MNSVSEVIVYPGRIGSGANRVLKGRCTGRIIMVSSKAWYLSFGDDIIIINDEIWGLVSFGITVHNFAGFFRKDRALENTHVTYSKGLLTLPGITVDLREAETVRDRKATASRELLRAGAAAVKERVMSADKGYMPTLLDRCNSIMTGGELRFGAGEDTFTAPTAERMQALFSAMNAGDKALTQEALMRFLGLGRGLTPSSDDWMLGFLYTVRALGHTGASALLTELIPDCASRCTNSISTAYLTNCAYGGTDERIQELIRTGGIPEAERILAIGSSSGADMLVGFLFALEYDKELKK